MDINVQNLDLGYDQCERLHTLAKTNGKALYDQLNANILNLKQDWIGSDATLHVNNLIKVYNALGLLLADAIGTSASAADKIIAMQKVRHANGSSGMVGSELSKEQPHTMAIGEAETTDRYYCSPMASVDLSQLEGICDDYRNFVNDFISVVDDLMANWTMGANREGAKASFDEFAQNTVTYEKFLADARENLSTAVSNLSQL